MNSSSPLWTNCFQIILQNIKYLCIWCQKIDSTQGFCTCRLFSGSIFMTGPMVLIGKETSILWLGISGVWMGRGLVGIIPKLHLGKKANIQYIYNVYYQYMRYTKLNLNWIKWYWAFVKHKFSSESSQWPVLVELDSKVSHVLQCLVGESHVHIHVTLAAREGAGDLQSLCFHCRQPHLVKSTSVIRPI